MSTPRIGLAVREENRGLLADPLVTGPAVVVDRAAAHRAAPAGLLIEVEVGLDLRRGRVVLDPRAARVLRVRRAGQPDEKQRHDGGPHRPRT